MLFPPPQNGTSSHRVVVTGLGLVTALGIGRTLNLQGFRTGAQAFRPVTLFDVSRQRVQQAAEVSLPSQFPSGKFTRRQAARIDRAGWLLFLAANEAWEQAGWLPGEQAPMVLGTTSGGMSLGESYYRQSIAPAEGRRLQAVRVAHYQVQQQALDLLHHLGFTGPITIIANACASGANAIGHAFDLVRRGLAERVVAGGYDALCQLVFAGFDSLQALSTTCCRPFDARRDGLALGEGAAVLMLETLDSARRRGAEIVAEIVGYGAANDSHHLTQPHPEGDAALASMTAACASARIRPEEIGYINAHGTGTALNDSAEAAAINRWANGSARKIPVSSTKASVGHLLGAAGAVEAAVCALALQEQFLPPMRGIDQPDPACQFPLVREPSEARFEYALSNSFGFGGANATLILRRAP